MELFSFFHLSSMIKPGLPMVISLIQQHHKRSWYQDWRLIQILISNSIASISMTKLQQKVQYPQ